MDEDYEVPSDVQELTILYTPLQIGDITNVALNRRIMLKTWERWPLRCFCWDN